MSISLMYYMEDYVFVEENVLKILTAALFGLIGAIFVALIYSGIMMYTGFTLVGLKIFFILPVGAFVMGMASTKGLYYGLKTFNLKRGSRMFILEWITSLICFISIYFFIYSFTYVSSDLNVNYNFNGNHISNYSYEGSNDRIDFIKYLNHDISSRRSDMFLSAGRTGVGVPIGSMEAVGAINWVMFLIECAGFIIGGTIVTSGLIGEYYCEECNKYLKRKKVSTLKISEYESLLAKGSNDALEKIIDMAKAKMKIPFFYLGKHWRIDIRYCPGCNQGTVILNQMEFEMYKFEKKPSMRQEFDVDSEIIKQLL